jgi:hypothetical protein
MGPGLGYETDGFVIDTDKDFTLSMWTVPYGATSMVGNKWLSSFGAVNFEGIAMGTYLSRYVVGYPNDQGGGMWMEETIRASKQVEGYPKDTNHNYFGFYDWQMVSLTKQKYVYGPGIDKITLYINGMEDRLSISAGLLTPGGDAVENEVFGSDQALYVGGAMHQMMGYPDLSANQFGIILVYDRVLKCSELRQNFLATNISKKYRGPTTSTDYRDRGYFYY